MNSCCSAEEILSIKLIIEMLTKWVAWDKEIEEEEKVEFSGCDDCVIIFLENIH